MPLFRKLMVSRSLVKECLTLDFRQGERLPTRCFLPVPAGTTFHRVCDTSPLTNEVSRHVQEPVMGTGRVQYYYFESGQGMIGDNAGMPRMLVCTRSAYNGGDVVVRSTRSRADKTVVAPCQGMVLLLSPFCAFDITPVESGSAIFAEVIVTAPSMDHVEAVTGTGEAAVRIFNSHHPLWPRHGSNVCFALRLLRDVRTGERVVEQMFMDGRWHTVLRTSCGNKVCVPADLVGQTNLEEVPFCDVTPEIMRRALAIDPPYEAVAHPHRCVYGAMDVRCANEYLVYCTFKTEPARRSTSSPGPDGPLSPATPSTSRAAAARAPTTPQEVTSPTTRLVETCLRDALDGP
nr:hypothetical protein [Orf virus]